MHRTLRFLLVLAILTSPSAIPGRGPFTPAALSMEPVAVHQAGGAVFGLAVGDLDRSSPGPEAVFLREDQSVVLLTPAGLPWSARELADGFGTIWGMASRPTIDLGDVHSAHPGSEVVVCAGFRTWIVHRDSMGGWAREVVYDISDRVGGLWGARAGDIAPWREGDEILLIYEAVFDFSNGLLLSEDGGTWSDQLVYQEEVGMDSTLGDVDPGAPGLELVVTTEMGPTYHLHPPDAPGPDLWPRETAWDDFENAGWVSVAADIEPEAAGDEVAYGTRYSNSILLARSSPSGRETQILHTGLATDRNMWDIAVGDVLPEAPGLEIAGVDDTGSVYLVHRLEGSWTGELVWTGEGPLYAVVAADLDPMVEGDELLVAGSGGTVTLLRRVVEDRDGDTTPDPSDCLPDDPANWTPPGEVPILRLHREAPDDAVHLAWEPPLDPGSATVRYDVLRAAFPAGFSSAVCVESDSTSVEGRDIDAGGELSFYLVRAENDCPEGAGSLGNDSRGGERTGRDCS